MKVSLLITTFMRDHLLELTLPTIINQKVDFDLEVIVINDGYPGIIEQVCNYFDVKYLFTGHRNLNKILWRVPGFAFNIAVKLCTGDIIILTCAEMYHLSKVPNTIQVIADPVISDPLAIGRSFGVLDDGTLLTNIEKINEIDYRYLPDYDSELPYFLALSRKVFIDIGGYDEDFIGIAGEDNDLMHRFTDFGGYYVPTPARLIHLYHEPVDKEVVGRERWKYNSDLMNQRRGILVRNIGREWGISHED